METQRYIRSLGMFTMHTLYMHIPYVNDGNGLTFQNLKEDGLWSSRITSIQISLKVLYKCLP